MCEWLSHAEWCDARLMCGGREFGAHRAVLASVSRFLRKILLSCHEESTPTLIVLPDFELESMFSVLYYIYNGEVVVPKSKLDSFLDIIITLEIFMDEQFVNKIKECVNGFDKKLERINSSIKEDIHQTDTGSVFKLECNDNDTGFINIKRRQRTSSVEPESLCGFDHRDKLQHYCNQNKAHTPYLISQQTQHTDRQTKSFLRDSFIETYPRNGIVNGLKTGVPPILSRRYLNSTSALLVNANSKDSDLAPAHAVASDNTKLSSPVQVLNDIKHTSVQYETECFWHNDVYNRSNSQQKPSEISCTVNCSKYVHKGTKKSPAFSIKQRVAGKPIAAFANLTETDGNIVLSNNENSLRILRGDNTETSSNAKKAVIYNHVMQSPWWPRLPVSYKPFRRKLHVHNDEFNMETEEAKPNDKNNNVESPSESLTELSTIKDTRLQCRDVSEPLQTSAGRDLKSTCETVDGSEEVSLHIRGRGDGRYTCEQCGKTFSQMRNYKYHMSVHRGTREFAATCPVCGKYFNDRGYLSSHMKIHRNRKEYKCSQCPKSFNQRVAYNMHVRIHTGIKPHICDECGKAFSRKMLLKQHQRIHSGERPYACAHCDRRFADRSNMTLHLRLHTGVKPFTCTVCAKSFTKKHHLKSHLNYHTGAKPYACPRCHLAFTQSSNMRTHLKKCNVVTPKT